MCPSKASLHEQSMPVATWPPVPPDNNVVARRRHFPAISTAHNGPCRRVPVTIGSADSLRGASNCFLSPYPIRPSPEGLERTIFCGR
uniref:Uncharacterized protein n=1 Tax=Panagrellus redivivus TaxID=6233 RepID=A0A7E4VE87_PANRE